jgi:hypothetical protein
MLSTMSLDFIQFDKPVINTVFGLLYKRIVRRPTILNYAPQCSEQ